MKYSMYKTFAAKYSLWVKRILDIYKKDKNFTVTYSDKKGKQKVAIFYNQGFKKKTGAPLMTIDKTPNVGYAYAVTSLIDRLQARTCELCGESDNLEMHHVRRLKDLKGKSIWERRMIARRRKTLAVCQECHLKIHAGKMD